jgi:hypothetical protein
MDITYGRRKLSEACEDGASCVTTASDEIRVAVSAIGSRLAYRSRYLGGNQSICGVCTEIISPFSSKLPSPYPFSLFSPLPLPWTLFFFFYHRPLGHRRYVPPSHSALSTQPCQCVHSLQRPTTPSTISFTPSTTPISKPPPSTIPQATAPPRRRISTARKVESISSTRGHSIPVLGDVAVRPCSFPSSSSAAWHSLPAHTGNTPLVSLCPTCQIAMLHWLTACLPRSERSLLLGRSWTSITTTPLRWCAYLALLVLALGHSITYLFNSEQTFECQHDGCGDKADLRYRLLRAFPLECVIILSLRHFDKDVALIFFSL